MNDRQKKAATGIAFLIILGATVFLLWLALVVSHGNPRGDRSPARLFMLLIANWDTLGIVFKSVLPIVSAVAAFLGAYKLKDWLFYWIVAVCFVGFLSAAYLLMELSSVATAKAFWAYSPVTQIQSYEAFFSAAQKGLIASGVWFAGLIALELGIKKLAS